MQGRETDRTSPKDESGESKDKQKEQGLLYFDCDAFLSRLDKGQLRLYQTRVGLSACLSACLSTCLSECPSIHHSHACRATRSARAPLTIVVLVAAKAHCSCGGAQKRKQT